MGINVRGAVPFAKSVVAGIQEKNVTFMAAGIAYQAFISLIPLLVLVFFLVSFVGDEALAQQVSSTTEGFLPRVGRSSSRTGSKAIPAASARRSSGSSHSSGDH